MKRDLANILSVFDGSDASKTIALYEELKLLGPRGRIALELFRIQKASSRAKVYRGGGYRGQAYDKKQWAMDNLCAQLEDEKLFAWEWKQDPEQEYHNQVLYVDLPAGQVSFHTSVRGKGPDYAGDWDGVKNMSAQRICIFVALIFADAAQQLSDCQRPEGER